MNFNGYLYSLLVRDLKLEFKDQYTNNSKYLILHGKYLNFIFLKENKKQVVVLFATEDKIIKRRVYRQSIGYRRILKRIKKDFYIWNN